MASLENEYDTNAEETGTTPAEQVPSKRASSEETLAESPKPRARRTLTKEPGESPAGRSQSDKGTATQRGGRALLNLAKNTPGKDPSASAESQELSDEDPRALYARERARAEERSEGPETTHAEQASAENNEEDVAGSDGIAEDSLPETTPEAGNPPVSTAEEPPVEPDISSNPELDEEKLIEILSERLEDSAEKFVESIERLPTEIPDKIAQGLSRLAAGELSRSLFPIVEKRVDELLITYRAVLKNQQKEFGFPVLMLTTTLTAVFCTVIVAITIFSTPTIEQIKRTEGLLKIAKDNARLHPPIVLYKGAPYVRVEPGTEATFKDKTGVHTYAKIPNLR